MSLENLGQHKQEKERKRIDGLQVIFHMKIQGMLLVVVDIETNSDVNKVTPIFKSIVESIYRLENEK